MLNQRWVVVVAFLLGIVVSLACASAPADRDGDELAESRTASNSATPNRSLSITATPALTVVTIGEARWPILNGESIKALVSAYDSIFVGTVASANLELDSPAEFPDSAQNEQPSGNPTLESSPVTLDGTPETTYSVAVEQVIAGSRLEEGGFPSVYQRGGFVGGTAYEIADDPLIDIGARYLFFVQDLQPQIGLDMFSGSPFGRFVIEGDGSLSAVAPVWTGLGGTSELIGLSMDSAVDRILEELPEAGQTN